MRRHRHESRDENRVRIRRKVPESAGLAQSRTAGRRRRAVPPMGRGQGRERASPTDRAAARRRPWARRRWRPTHRGTYPPRMPPPARPSEKTWPQWSRPAAALNLRRAAELGQADDQRLVQHAAVDRSSSSAENAWSIGGTSTVLQPLGLFRRANPSTGRRTARRARGTS